MSRYQNVNCPICNKSLSNGESVVVCPQCGAPYHLDCYKVTGVCIFDDLHRKNESWKPPFFESKFTETLPISCVRCGASNPADGLFCRMCNADLANQESIPFPQRNDGTPIAGMPISPFAPTFEPITAHEEIDGIKASELAAFVGRNAQYYLHCFKQLSKTLGKHKIINWASFMFMGWYYIYRKMYLIGISIIATQVILNIPYYIMLMQEMANTTPFMASSVDITSLTTANMVSNLILILLRFLCGYYANSLYKYHTGKKIARIKEKTQLLGEEIYMAKLSKSGGVAIKLIFGISLIYLIGSMMSLIIIMLK